MKGSYFGFGIPQQQVNTDARWKNTFIVLFFTLFAQRLPNYSFNDSFFQTPNLQWLVRLVSFWFHQACNAWKQRLWAQCCFVYSVTGERHLVAKNELAFSFRPTWKDHKWAGTMLMLHVDFNIKRLGIRFKNNSFQWFRVDSFFWETISLNTEHF